MPHVKVEIVFESVTEARDFFVSQPASSPLVPPQAVSPPPPPAPLPPQLQPAPSVPPASAPSAAAGATSPAPPSGASSAPAASEDFLQKAKDAMTAMLLRCDSKAPGTGATTARQILDKHSLKRIRDVADSNVAAQLIAAFEAA